MKEIYELDVYCLAEKLSDKVWQAFDEWSAKAQNTMGYQLIRAADSIAANIAEGYGRHSTADRRRFYIYARGLFEETKAWMRKAIRRKVIGSADVKGYKAIIDELGPKMNGFIRSTPSVKGQASKAR